MNVIASAIVYSGGLGSNPVPAILLVVYGNFHKLFTTILRRMVEVAGPLSNLEAYR
jgi:hypothetical protein